MTVANQGSSCAVGMFFCLVFLVGCASIPRLEATYQLPPGSDGLKRESMALVVKDVRSTKEIIAPGAAEEFQRFPGSVTLRVARPSESSVAVGLYDPPGMVRETFQRRLENLGASVTSRENPDAFHLVILLEEFRLDLVDRKWVARMSYEARIEKDGKLLAGQSITGSAERLKVIGRKGADEVTSEVVTDTVNRLEIERLFRQARQVKG